MCVICFNIKPQRSTTPVATLYCCNCVCSPNTATLKHDNLKANIHMDRQSSRSHSKLLQFELRLSGLNWCYLNAPLPSQVFKIVLYRDHTFSPASVTRCHTLPKDKAKRLSRQCETQSPSKSVIPQNAFHSTNTSGQRF